MMMMVLVVVEMMMMMMVLTMMMRCAAPDKYRIDSVDDAGVDEVILDCNELEAIHGHGKVGELKVNAHQNNADGRPGTSLMIWNHRHKKRPCESAWRVLHVNKSMASLCCSFTIAPFGTVFGCCCQVSRCQNLLAYTIDGGGDEQYSCWVRDLRSRRLLVEDTVVTEQVKPKPFTGTTACCCCLHGFKA